MVDPRRCILARVDRAEAQRIVLERIASGAKVAEAMAAVGRSAETWRDWRKKDAEFKAKSDTLRAKLAGGDVANTSGSKVPDFPEFCDRYLKRPMPLHNLRIWDVVCEREPRDLHPSMQYQPGFDPGRYMIINVPPDHSKSTTWAVMFSLWEIVRNPDIRIAIVSKTQQMAVKFLSQLKMFLTASDLYPDLHAEFAPAGGWRSPDTTGGLSWREDKIYVQGRTSAEKEPTVEALGVGSQIYGTRFDMIILDDIEDMSTAGHFERHADWIGQEVFNRLDAERGRLLVLGTRVGVMDVYRKLRDDAITEDGDPFYTYFAQPAILEGEGGPSADWVTLWPERYNAKKLANAKAAMTDRRRFVFNYQQRDVGQFSTFPHEAVDAAVDQRRFPGPMIASQIGHRQRGMDGLYVVAGLDPATTGYTAGVVMGVDPTTRVRWVLDCFNTKGANPQQIIALIKDWTVKFGINEWRIERNAFQRFLTQLEEVTRFLQGRGVILREHVTTGNNKWDSNFGVETLAPLFLSCVDEVDNRLVAKPDGHGLINLPAPRRSANTGTLMEQLKTWEPEMSKHVPQDLVMALWFADLGAREQLERLSNSIKRQKSRFMPRRTIRKSGSFSWDELVEQQREVAGV